MITRAGRALPALASARVRWYVLAGASLWDGLGYALGPDQWASSGSFDVMRQLMPMRAWGVTALVVLAALVVNRFAGHVLGILYYLAFSLLVGAAYVTGSGVGWSGAYWAFLVAMAHWQGLVIALQERETDR